MTENGNGGIVSSGGASADPVFVLCGGRTGSTLLRFLLDAHPDLACPPETNVPGSIVPYGTGLYTVFKGAHSNNIYQAQYVLVGGKVHTAPPASPRPADGQEAGGRREAMLSGVGS